MLQWQKVIRIIWAIRRAKAVVEFVQTNEASLWLFNVGMVDHNLWFDFSPFQSTWMVFGDVFMIDKVTLLEILYMKHACTMRVSVYSMHSLACMFHVF